MATLEELIDSLGGEEGVKQLSNRELGKLADPSSKDLSTLEKILSRAAAFSTVFGTDSEVLGSKLRPKLFLNEALAMAEDKRAEKKKQRDMLGLLDADLSGNVSAGELPLDQQDLLRSRGLFPKKTVDFSKDIHGPTRSLFQTVLAPDEVASGDVVPDEFGGTIKSVEGQALSPFGEKVMDAEGANLFDALTKGMIRDEGEGTRSVEAITRQFDRSLQGSEQVDDPDAALPNAVARQVFESVSTDVRTPRSQAAMVDPASADQYLSTLESAAGIPIGTVKRPETPMSSSQLASLGSSVSSLINNKADNLAKEQRQKEYTKKQKEMFDMKADLSRELQNDKQQFSFGSAVVLKGIGFDNQRRLDDGRATRRETFARAQAKTGFENQVTLFEKKAELTGAEGELNRQSALVRAIVNGSQKIQAQDLAQLDKIALADHEAGTGRFNKHLDFYYKMVKAYPAITGDIAEILASVPPGTIAPATEEAIRGALDKEARDTFSNRSVESTLEAVTAGVWGVSAENKALALWSQSKLLKMQGVDTSLLDEALTYLDSKKSGQTININTGSPIKTAGERADIAGLRQLLSNIDYIGGLYSSEYTGWLDNLEAKGKSLIGLSPQREEFFRASVAELKSTIAKLRAGGAIGPAEERFLLEAIPDIGIPDSQFVARFNNFKRITQGMLGERYSLLGYTAKTRADELELMGKTDPAEVERILVTEGLLEPRERKGGK